ncbi:hypothetical protein [Gayadomonas joobiniege]|uniref:hypothetical protein n=1 Tax=Gayadomonas joobiniege TaxID=1234606 RepID=UPI00037D44FE|nr:hypothetical protein [Gayadomonas joobiniege]
MKLAIKWGVLSSVLLFSAAAQADLYVIVNKQNPIQTLSKSQLIDIYTGRYVAFPNSREAKPVDLVASHPLKEVFYQRTTGLSLSKISSYWARIKFTGRYNPPQEYQSLEEVLDYVSRTPQAIGYVDASLLPELKNNPVKVIYSVDL